MSHILINSQSLRQGTTVPRQAAMLTTSGTLYRKYCSGRNFEELPARPLRRQANLKGRKAKEKYTQGKNSTRIWVTTCHATTTRHICDGSAYSLVSEGPNLLNLITLSHNSPNLETKVLASRAELSQRPPIDRRRCHIPHIHTMNEQTKKNLESSIELSRSCERFLHTRRTWTSHLYNPLSNNSPMFKARRSALVGMVSCLSNSGRSTVEKASGFLSSCPKPGKTTGGDIGPFYDRGQDHLRAVDEQKQMSKCG
ncbi:uncharacterized protein LY89DRAFT_675824 [Mollisia scopiformis]|uniref:Uncharacterized protein n=1 Tax=Mollisia scopiformis TaxID=149040 RepID=A0A132BB87_MOLSC|nr:uncharacterized protein LY89DRAFT_675824 [Mollisia scopiformis]KUJ09656.1 hypothetical protein LY89DRAFT_675824 [Mollisia scopiformis]